MVKRHAVQEDVGRYDALYAIVFPAKRDGQVRDFLPFFFHFMRYFGTFLTNIDSFVVISTHSGGFL